MNISPTLIGFIAVGLGAVSLLGLVKMWLMVRRILKK